MSLNTDLMGLGMPAQLADKLAPAIPLTITAAGTTYAGSTKLKQNQYLVSCANGNNTLSLGLPAVGGSTGCALADYFHVYNSSVDTVVIRTSTSVLMGSGGTYDSAFLLGPSKSVLLRPISSTAWASLYGA